MLRLSISIHSSYFMYLSVIHSTYLHVCAYDYSLPWFYSRVPGLRVGWLGCLPLRAFLLIKVPVEARMNPAMMGDGNHPSLTIIMHNPFNSMYASQTLMKCWDGIYGITPGSQGLLRSTHSFIFARPSNLRESPEILEMWTEIRRKNAALEWLAFLLVGTENRRSAADLRTQKHAAFLE